MFTVMVNLDSINRIKRFVEIIIKSKIDAELVSGRYVVDAKSIMGIFSLDLIHPLQLNIFTETKEEFEEISNKLKDFIVEGS